VVGYCIARAAAEHNVQIHAAQALSNHYHGLVTDPGGVISAFAGQADALIARCLNARYGDRESLWSSAEGLSLVAVASIEDAFEKLVYIENNVVAAGLVASSRAWPGLRITPADALRGPDNPLVFKRPPQVFSPDGECPEEVTLTVTLPPNFEQLGSSPKGRKGRKGRKGLSAKAFVARVEAEVARGEAQAREQRQRDGRQVIGVVGVRKQSRKATATTPEKRGTRRPTVACKDREERVARLTRLVDFRRLYGAALVLWMGGEAGVVFPYGTNKLRGHPGVVIDKPPDADHPPPYPGGPVRGGPLTTPKKPPDATRAAA
jgi:hypothetical protein